MRHVGFTPSAFNDIPSEAVIKIGSWKLILKALLKVCERVFDKLTKWFVELSTLFEIECLCVTDLFIICNY